MPRQSADAAAAEAAKLTTISVQARRVKPPAGLPAPVVAIWAQLVDTLPADRFHQSDRPLLALYCRALHQAALAYEKLEKHGAAYQESISPWQRIVESAVKQAATLATRLRLCPQSRLDRKIAGPAARTDHDAPRPWEPSE